jgi:hypothetical protein
MYFSGVLIEQEAKMTKRWSSPGSTFKYSNMKKSRPMPQRHHIFQRQTNRDAEKSRVLDRALNMNRAAAIQLNTNRAALLQPIVDSTSKWHESD